MTEAKVKWYPEEINAIRTNFRKGMVKMGFAMQNQAKLNAPVLTSALRNSIRVDDTQSDAVYIRAGGQVGRFNVPYAARREFENNLHPSTRYYMTRAYNSVVTGDITKYFMEVAK